MPTPQSAREQWLASRAALRFLRDRFTDGSGRWLDGAAQLAGVALEKALGFCPACGTCGSAWTDQQADTGQECAACGSPVNNPRRTEGCR